jgi:hypothetical protein
MADVGDIPPLHPVWPVKPEDRDAARKRKPPAEPKERPVPKEHPDDEPGHIDEYATGA